MDFPPADHPGLPLAVAAAGFVLVLLVGVSVASIYNTLVKLRYRFENAYSQIDVQLKRRHDLIPNLVEVVKGYLAHERETLEAVVAARGGAVAAGERARATPGQAAAMQLLAGAEQSLVAALGRLFAVVESYPDLKANQNMLSLQEELSSTENKIAFARQAYNDAVMVYNTRVGSFPAVLVAKALGFAPAALYQIDAPGEREVPAVSFGK